MTTTSPPRDAAGTTHAVLQAAANAATDTELTELIWVMAVPVLIADYTPLLERFAGYSEEEVVARLDDNDELLRCLDLIGDRARSRPWAELYGRGGDDVPGLGERLANPAEYSVLKTNMIKQLSAPWSGRRTVVFEHSVPTGRDTTVAVRSHWSVASSNGEPDWTRVAIVDLDVTALRTAEHNLAEADRLEAIGRIAAGVAHELNTPLQYISDNLQFLSDETEGLLTFIATAAEVVGEGEVPELADAAGQIDLPFLREEMPDALAQSLEGLRAMSKIVKALKEFSHGGSDEAEPADINHLVETAVAVGRNEWKYVADVVCELEEDLPRVEVFGQELSQVILNLIVNAAHAIGDNCEGKGTITITTKDHGDHISIAIADNGGGVPADLRERIFDPFFTTKEVGKGTGQGLAMAQKSIVGRHRGSLDLDVEDGHGSTFIISIPRTPVETS